MEYKKDFFDGEKIPDFALQPAKPASTFDPTVYDRLFANMKQSAKTEVQTEPAVEAKPVAAGIPIEKPPEAEPVFAGSPKELSQAELPAAGQPEAKPVMADPPKVEPESTVVVAAHRSKTELAEADQPEVEPESTMVADLPEVEPEGTMVAAADQPEVEPESTMVAAADQPEVEPESTMVAAEPVTVKVASNFAKEPFAPAAAAVPVHMPQKPLPVKIEAVPDGQRNRKVKYTDFRRISPATIHVEEDILITDTKPDMVQMLSVEGSCQLAERRVPTGTHGLQSLRVTGDLKVQALYTAEDDADEPIVVSLDTKILFREDCVIKGEPNSVIDLCAELCSMEWERINERKFRIRADVEIRMREYCERELELFDSIGKEEVQFLQDEIQFTDIAIRKTEIMEVSEEIRLREGTPEIDKILCFNVNLVENHKQVSNEKAMINVTVYLNLLYKSDGCPVFYKCKTEFTQFIRMDEGGFDYPLLSGRTRFDILDCSLTAKRDEEGYCTILCLNMDVETTLEYYRQVQEPCITDLYHYSKDVEYDRIQKELNCFCGSEAADIPVREIVDIPDRYGKAEQAIYITGSPKIKSNQSFQGKIMVEGVLPIRLVCIGGESGKLPFSIDRELEFRTSMDMPGCLEGMEVDSQAIIKELWFDQINNRQIAVNAEIAVSAYAFEKSAHELIHTVSITERGEKEGAGPAIIVYAVKEGDTVWKVAKKYYAPVSRVRAINDLAEHEEIRAGSKILIVR